MVFTDSRVSKLVISLANTPRYSYMLQLIRGAVLLGVPNLGMNQAHLEAAVRGQANTKLVEYLRPENDALIRMDETFAHLAVSQRMNLLWGYEILESPTRFVSLDIPSLGVTNACSRRKRAANLT